MPGYDRSHYGWRHDQRAKQVRDAANANPLTRCWKCGLTLDQVRAKFPGRRVVWDAGHTIDGDPHCALLAECSPCNRGGGADLTNWRHKSSGGTGRV